MGSESGSPQRSDDDNQEADPDLEDAMESFEKAQETPKRRSRPKKEPYDSRYHPSGESIPKKPKDTHSPKRPMSAYFLFMQAKRASYKERDPKLKMADIHKQLADEWKNMDAT